MSIQATRHTPKALVSFSTEQGEITLRIDNATQGYAIDKEVLNISTNNDIQADAGTFQITLVNRQRWDKILASNDFVRIQMYRDDDGADEKTATVMMGLVDDVRKTVSLQGGAPQRTITVTGRTFAKALINFEVGVVQETNITTSSLGWIMGRINFAGQSASKIVQQIFDILIYQYMNYEFKNGGTFKSYMNLKLASRPGEKLFDDKSFINYQGSMQSFLREIINDPFNEMFWEFYNDGLSTFVTRETPFNQDNWNNLPTHKVYDEDVIIDSVGRSDIETYTLFSVGMQNFFNTFDINQTLMVFPYWSEAYFKKFGLRRLQRYTGYVGYGSSDDVSNSRDQLMAYQRDLYNWNIMNPTFYNGYLTVKGSNKYKIGERLLYLSKEDGRMIEFYIESVAHDFTNYGTWITKLGVTRGLENGGEGRFNAPWDSYKEYQGGALGDPVISDSTTTGTTNDSSFTLPENVDPTALASSIITYAESFIGHSSYLNGAGRTDSDISLGIFDCSSFVHYVYKQNGVTLVSDSPVGVTTQNLVKTGLAVDSLVEMKPGDLIFFDTNRKNGHVGIWIGNGQWIGCQSSHGVAIENFDSTYWRPKFSGNIRRVLLDLN